MPKPSHIPYPPVDAAIRGGDLRFIQRHAREINVRLPDAVEVCLLIADQRSDQLEAASVHWIRPSLPRPESSAARTTG